MHRAFGFAGGARSENDDVTVGRFRQGRGGRCGGIDSNACKPGIVRRAIGQDFLKLKSVRESARFFGRPVAANQIDVSGYSIERDQRDEEFRAVLEINTDAMPSEFDDGGGQRAGARQDFFKGDGSGRGCDCGQLAKVLQPGA